MAATYDPQKILNRWKNNFANSTEKYKDGVRAVEVAPTQRAKAAKDKAKAGYIRSMDDGTFDAGCDSVTLQDWQNRTINIGAANLMNGAVKGSERMLRFIETGLPTTLRIAAQIRAMPNATEADRDQRVIQYIKLMRENKYSRRGRSR